MKIIYLVLTGSDSIRDMVEDAGDIENLVKLGQKNPSAKHDMIRVYDIPFYVFHEGELPTDQDALKKEITDFLGHDVFKK